jgi:hypothetical protein
MEPFLYSKDWLSMQLHKKTTYCATCFRINNQVAIHETTIPNLCQRPNPNAHIRVFKKAIKANGETMEANIINLFGFSLKDNISKWGENYIQDHPNCNFGLSLYNLF